MNRLNFINQQSQSRNGLIALLAGGMVVFATVAPVDADPVAGGITGLVVGAGVGAVVGGSKGAVKGAVIGTTVGVIAGAVEQERRKKRRVRARRNSGTVNTSYVPEKKYPQAPVFDSHLVEETQVLLVEHGFDPGPIDGVYGSRTAQAISEYQEEFDLVVDGEPSEPLLEHMRQNEG